MLKQIKYSIIIIAISISGSLNGQIMDTLCVPAIGKYRFTSSPNHTYQWFISSGTMLSANGLDSLVVDWPDIEGIYTIGLVAFSDKACPGDTIFKQVLVKEPLLVDIIGPDSICFGETVELNAVFTNGSNPNYQEWNTGSVTTTIKVKPDSNSMYVFSAYGCNYTEDNHAITVLPIPQPDFYWAPIEPEVGFDVDFTYSGTAWDHMNWHVEKDKVTIDSDLMTYVFNDYGTFEVEVEVTKDGCYGSVRKEVDVIASPAIYVPNAFTPNGDLKNEIFTAKGRNLTDFRLIIFNRWGEKLFETTDIHEGWNGNFNGKLCPTGVYTWVIHYRGVMQKSYLPDRVKRGTVTLLR